MFSIPTYLFNLQTLNPDCRGFGKTFASSLPLSGHVALPKARLTNSEPVD